MARPSFLDPREFVRQQLVTGVRKIFNDTQSGEAPVPPSDEAYFARDTPIRMVHADLVSMMVGGMSALLLQMLHPHALQGILDFSNFRKDMHGRLRRTARFIAVTTYGHADDADKAIARVNAIHAKVRGTLPDGTAYAATNPRTLAWVHVTEAVMFLESWLAHVQPDMPLAQQDEYFRQFALIARKLGADPVPETKAEADKVFRELRADLRPSARGARSGAAYSHLHRRRCGRRGAADFFQCRGGFATPFCAAYAGAGCSGLGHGAEPHCDPVAGRHVALGIQTKGLAQGSCLAQQLVSFHYALQTRLVRAVAAVAVRMVTAHQFRIACAQLLAVRQRAQPHHLQGIAFRRGKTAHIGICIAANVLRRSAPDAVCPLAYRVERIEKIGPAWQTVRPNIAAKSARFSLPSGGGRLCGEDFIRAHAFKPVIA